MLSQYITTKRFLILSSLLFVILLSYFFVFSFIKIQERRNAALTQESEVVRRVVEGEVNKFTYGLQGTRGAMLVAHGNLSAEDFRQYALSRDLFSNFKGAIGFGFIRNVKNADLPAYQKKMQVQRAGFKIHPKLEAPSHGIIELIEPIEQTHQALGLDIFFEAGRKSASERAAITGQLALTKLIHLVQLKTDELGFLYLLPVYQSGKTPTTETARLKELVGWAYAPVVLKILLAEIAEKIPSQTELNFHIDDEIKTIGQADHLSTLPGFKDTETIEVLVGGKTWTVQVHLSNASLNQSLLELILIYLLGMGMTLLTGIQIYRRLILSDQKLEEQTEFLKAIIQSAGHSIIACLPDQTITLFNPAAEKILGYEAKEVLGTRPEQSFHDPEEVAARTAELAVELGRPIGPGFDVFVAKSLSGTPDVKDWNYVRKDGAKVPVRLCVSSIFDSNRKLIGFLGIGEDLRQFKELSATIDAQRAAMIEESKMSKLGEMAGGIAHEINTPLAIIIVKSSQIRKKIEAAESWSRSEAIIQLEKIELTAHRIARIVKSLMQYSRNASEDPLSDISAMSAIEDTLDLCTEALKNAQIKVSVEASGPALIRARASEVSQALMNLISNSIDATEGQLDPWLKIRVVKTNRVRVEVIDSGNAIDQAVAQKMMDPFFTTKEVGKGTGLGLSVSRKLVQSHGGELRYEPDQNHTRFILDYPLVDGLSQA